MSISKINVALEKCELKRLNEIERENGHKTQDATVSMLINQYNTIEAIENDIEDFMHSSKIWGYQGDKDTSDIADQVFIAFKEFIKSK